MILSRWRSLWSTNVSANKGQCRWDELDLPGVRRADDVHTHLVVRQCQEVVPRTQVCRSIQAGAFVLSDSYRVNIEHRMLGDPAATMHGIDQDLEKSSTDSSGKDEQSIKGTKPVD